MGEPSRAGATFDLWAIYRQPTDYPQTPFVIRRFTFANGATTPGGCFEAETLDEARAHLPRGRTWLGRHPQDLPTLVETWV
jgi:hypothetical protein